MRLRKRSKGPKVRLLQEALIDIGFDLDADGNFGGSTERAVREFQRSMGIKIDGVVGPRTASMLGIDLGDEGDSGRGQGGTDTEPVDGGSPAGTDVVFTDETIPPNVQQTIDECGPMMAAQFTAALAITHVALNNFETAVQFESTSNADPDILGVVVDYAFEFGTRKIVELVPGGGEVLGMVNAVRDELFRAGKAKSDAEIGSWIGQQRRVLEDRRGLFFETNVKEELVLSYLGAPNREQRAAELSDLKVALETAMLERAALPEMEDLELIMYENWINAHFVRIGEDTSGCIEYRFEDESPGIIILSVKVDAPQAADNQLDSALNVLFNSGRLTLASKPIDMFVRKRACFKTENFVPGGTQFFCGWLDKNNQVIHAPIKDRADQLFRASNWREAAKRFRS